VSGVSLTSRSPVSSSYTPTPEDSESDDPVSNEVFEVVDPVPTDYTIAVLGCCIGNSYSQDHS
jgi:hypothetical protein